MIIIAHGVGSAVALEDLARHGAQNSPIIYSDAEGHGNIAAVACCPDGSVHYTTGMVPRALVKRLRQRLTQIVAFELYAAIVAVLTFVAPGKSGRSMVFVDNKAALACLIRSYSKQPDLNAMIGGLSARCAQRTMGVEYHFVPTKLNLADGPSRNEYKHMRELGAVEVLPVLPDWNTDMRSWMV